MMSLPQAGGCPGETSAGEEEKKPTVSRDMRLGLGELDIPPACADHHRQLD